MNTLDQEQIRFLIVFAHSCFKNLIHALPHYKKAASNCISISISISIT